MRFADLKNDYIFRRIFGTHPDILRRLLNDLLERTGEQTIDHIEYLPSEQLPLVAGAKLSVLDVRCKDLSGNKFVVEMQLLHMSGFLNRVIYHACKAYADQLAAGEPYAKLTDVVVISICNYEQWPDAEQDKQRLRRVPMLSRWYVTERSLDREDLKNDPNKLLQVQYAFLELPKLPEKKPDAGAALWAWLFGHAPELTEIPADLPPGPYREALDLANQANFTQLQLEAYRRSMDEIQQLRDYGAQKRAEGFAQGVAERLAQGVAEGLAQSVVERLAKGVARALLAILEARGITISIEARARIEACKDSATLDRWIVRAATAGSVEEVLAAATEARA